MNGTHRRSCREFARSPAGRALVRRIAKSFFATETECLVSFHEEVSLVGSECAENDESANSARYLSRITIKTIMQEHTAPDSDSNLVHRIKRFVNLIYGPLCANVKVVRLIVRYDQTGHDR